MGVGDKCTCFINDNKLFRNDEQYYRLSKGKIQNNDSFQVMDKYETLFYFQAD